MRLTRAPAIRILHELENLLAEKGIKLLSEDREGSEEEAYLYDCEYHELEDAVTDILVERVAAGQKNCGPANSPDDEAKAVGGALRSTRR